MQFQRRRKGRIKWRHLGQYRRRAGGGAAGRVGDDPRRQPKSTCNRFKPKRDNKSGSRLSCSELQRHIIKIFIESRVGGGREEVGG